jgi:hypothetical protein
MRDEREGSIFERSFGGRFLHEILVMLLLLDGIDGVKQGGGDDTVAKDGVILID